MSSPFSDYDDVLRDLPNLSFNALVALRKQIGEEIDALHHRLNYLTDIQSKLAPIAHLPPEILAKIFSLVRVREDGRVLVKQMLPSIWVSRHWREVALGEPTLWDHIDRSNCRWAIWCLARSKDAPLFVTISEQANGMMMGSMIASTLFGQLHRMKELRVVERDAGLDRLWGRPNIFDFGQAQSNLDILLQLSSLSGGTAPGTVTLLQTLHLEKKVVRDVLDFSNYAKPHLAHVKLQVCTFDWGELLLPSLRTLWIEDPTPQIHTFDLLRYLSNMPLLEELTLMHAFSEESASILGLALPQVYCPKLASLKVLNYQSNPVIELVTNIQLPEHVFLSMGTYISREDSLEDVVFCFIPIVQRRFTALEMDAITLSTPSLSGVSLAFGQRLEGGVLGGTVIDIKETRGFGPSDRIYHFQDILRIVRNLPLVGVKRLHVPGHFQFLQDGDFNAFISLLKLMPSVEELLAESYTAMAFLQYLADPSSPSAPLPPSMKSVTFSKMYIHWVNNLLDKNQIQRMKSRRNERGFRMVLRDPELKLRSEEKGVEKGRIALEAVMDEVGYANEVVDSFSRYQLQRF